MRVLKQVFITFAIVMGLSLAICAQKDDQKRPPKNPPVVNPGQRPPPKDPPKGEQKPKKPSYALEIADKIFLVTSA